VIDLLTLLTFNPILQFNYVPPKLCGFHDVPLVSCCKVTDVMPVNSTKHLMDNWIPVLSYGCVPGASLHA